MGEWGEGGGGRGVEGAAAHKCHFSNDLEQLPGLATKLDKNVDD